jgi:glyoxalase-like protein
MAPQASASAGPSQLPPAGQLTLDHIAHFIPDVHEAAAVLERLGFTVTPFSAQVHRVTPGGPLVPAGTGNRCVMFERGYLEFLTPTAATPVADQLRSAMARYVGAHLVAFGTAAPNIDHSRLAKHGFAPLAPVALQREIETQSGMATARFTVVRVPPGTMAEGRIQFCQHHTPELLWQPRWLSHRNGVRALSGVVLCVADLNEAAARYARYTGLTPHMARRAWSVETAYGYLLCTTTDALREYWRLDVPAVPWIGGALLTTTDMRAADDGARNAGCVTRNMGPRLLVSLPAALGGFFIYESPGAGQLRFEQ